MVTFFGIETSNHMTTLLERTKRTDTWIYFAPVGEGGLAKYSVHQAAALSDAGVEVVFLGREHMRSALESVAPQIEFFALRESEPGRGRIAKAMSWIRRLRSETRQLVDLTNQRVASRVLFASYAEYFSPFWVRPLVGLRDRGVRFGTIVHDPVRDFRIGPRLWHEYCVAKAYSFVDVAFVHDDTPVDLGRPKQALRTEAIEIGTFDVPDDANPSTRREVRESLGIPTDAKVLLSFGHVRDGKNIDLLIKSMPQVSELHLLVVGREQSSSQRSIRDYQDLAKYSDVADRCHWVNEFVAERDVHRYFQASDFMALLYSGDFQSASAVLTVASQFRLPVIASSGGGPLCKCVEEFGLGVWVPPDDLGAVKLGLKQLVGEGEKLTKDSRWSDFREAHSWQRNAERVIECMM